MATTRNVKKRIKALYESVGRGFESLPSHQEKPRHIVLGLFFFLCDREDSNSTALRSRVSNLFYPLRFFCQMRYRPSVIRVSR